MDLTFFMGRYFSDGIFKRKMVSVGWVVAATYIIAKKKDINTYAEG